MKYYHVYWQVPCIKVSGQDNPLLGMGVQLGDGRRAYKMTVAELQNLDRRVVLSKQHGEGWIVSSNTVLPGSLMHDMLNRFHREFFSEIVPGAVLGENINTVESNAIFSVAVNHFDQCLAMGAHPSARPSMADPVLLYALIQDFDIHYAMSSSGRTQARGEQQEMLIKEICGHIYGNSDDLHAWVEFVTTAFMLKEQAESTDPEPMTTVQIGKWLFHPDYEVPA